MKDNVSENLIQHNLAGQTFGFSAVDMSELGATEYTLVSVVCDKSGSVGSYKKELEKCIQEVVKACKTSPRADYLLLRLVAFDDTMEEIHGFKELKDCDPASYQNCINIGGTTMLYDASRNAITATTSMSKQMFAEDYTANAIVFIITDGMDNASSSGSDEVKKAMAAAMKTETLESIMTILIGVGAGSDPDIDQYLDKFRQDSNLTEYISLSNADNATLAKLADFISKSVSSQSQALGSGGASQVLQF